MESVSSQVEEASIAAVIGGAGGPGTTLFAGGQNSRKAVSKEAKNE